MTKIGLIRCEIAMRSYPGAACFAAIKNRTGYFSIFAGEDIEITGMISC